MLDTFHRRSADFDAVRAVSGLLVLNNSDRSRGARENLRQAVAALMRMHDEAKRQFRAIKQYFERHIERMLLRLQRDSRIAKDAPVAARLACSTRSPPTNLLPHDRQRV